MRVVRKALTFDDVLLVPAHSLVVPREVSLATRLTRSITLNIPLVSAAMDTVTEARLAIAIAQEGGLGIIHKNMPPAKQAAEVAKVKRFESGVVKDPITIPPTMSVREVLALKQQHRFSGLPVVEAGASSASSPTATCGSRPNLDQPVANIMTKGDRLVTVPEGTDLETAKALMHRHRLERVLVVNDAASCAASSPSRTSSSRPSTRTPARTSTAACASARRSASPPTTRSASSCSSAAGVDVIVVDTAHGHSQGVLDRVQLGEEALPAGAGRSAATSPPRPARRRWSTTAPTASRSASARARSARRGSSPASACRRSPRSRTRSRARRRPASRSSPTAASATPATSPRRSPPAPRR